MLGGCGDRHMSPSGAAAKRTATPTPGPSLTGCWHAGPIGARLTFRLRGRRPLDTQVQGVQRHLHVRCAVPGGRLLCAS